MAIKKENLLFHYNAMFNISDTEHSDITETWYNLSGSSKNGIVYDGTWGNNFLFLDGKTAWVNAGVYPLSNEVTAEVLFQTPIVNNTDERNLIDNAASGGIFIEVLNNKIIGNCYYNEYKEISTSVKPNELTYVALTVKDNVMKLYKNGILQGQYIADGNFSLNSSVTPIHCFALGANTTSSTTVESRFFRGKIYSSRAYDVALTDNEIYDNFKTDKAMFDLSELQSAGNVSKVRIGQSQSYDLKDIYSRNNKLSKTEDDTAFGLINFTKGVQINKAKITYDEVNNIVTFI